MNVGVIGLGNMGFGIAKNLINKGYNVFGYDIDAQKCEKLEAEGGTAAQSCAALGEQVTTAIIMVFSPEHVRQVIFGDNGLAKTLKSGSYIMITASVGPDVVEEVEAALAEKGIGILDAPLMADVSDAAQGQMHMMVGATKETIDACAGLLKDMSSALYYVGDKAGMGQSAKMCLQTLFSLTFEAGFEVVTLSRKAGLNMDEMHKLFKACPSSSVLFHATEENVNNRIFENTFNPLSILDKDIHLAMDMADKLDVLMPASQGTGVLFREAMKHYAKEDIWAAVKVVEAGKQLQDKQ